MIDVLFATILILSGYGQQFDCAVMTAEISTFTMPYVDYARVWFAGDFYHVYHFKNVEAVRSSAAIEKVFCFSNYSFELWST